MTEIPSIRASASEKELLQFVRDCAAIGGWMMYHTFDSRRSEGGYPDVTAVHPDLGRLVFAELKSAKGDWRPGQQEWLRALHRVADAVDGWAIRHVEVYLWRPSDADEILHVFLAHRGVRVQGGTL